MRYNTTSNNSNLYLDACSTTPPLKSVIEEISRIQMYQWGNPSSLHKFGLRSAEILERSRYDIAKCFKFKEDQIVFTSGATESINLAIRGSLVNTNPGRIVISSVEHPAVVSATQALIRYGWEVITWPVDNHGIIKLEYLEELVSPPTKLVSLIWGQSEIGSIQPVKLVGEICRNKNIIFHIDASQIISQGLFNLDDIYFDLISLSAHKFQGPQGIGMLLMGDNIKDCLTRFHGAGEQEYGIRSGTQAVALVAGMSIAVNSIKKRLYCEHEDTIFEETKVKNLTNLLRKELTLIKGLKLTGHPSKRLPHHLSFTVSDENNSPISGRDIVRELSRKGLFISSGTACSSGQANDSLILEAIGVEKQLRQSGIRLSLGPWLCGQDLNQIPSILRTVIEFLTIR